MFVRPSKRRKRQPTRSDESGRSYARICNKNANLESWFGCVVEIAGSETATKCRIKRKKRANVTFCFQFTRNDSFSYAGLALNTANSTTGPCFDQRSTNGSTPQRVRNLHFQFELRAITLRICILHHVHGTSSAFTQMQLKQTFFVFYRFAICPPFNCVRNLSRPTVA